MISLPLKELFVPKSEALSAPPCHGAPQLILSQMLCPHHDWKRLLASTTMVLPMPTLSQDAPRHAGCGLFQVWLRVKIILWTPVWVLLGSENSAQSFSDRSF